jgi:hypothetical protein
MKGGFQIKSLKKSTHKKRKYRIMSKTNSSKSISYTGGRKSRRRTAKRGMFSKWFY